MTEAGAFWSGQLGSIVDRACGEIGNAAVPETATVVSGILPVCLPVAAYKSLRPHEMKQRVLYGGQSAEVESAAGVHGVLIRGLGGTMEFRVYHPDG